MNLPASWNQLINQPDKADISMPNKATRLTTSTKINTLMNRYTMADEINRIINLPDWWAESLWQPYRCRERRWCCLLGRRGCYTRAPRPTLNLNFKMCPIVFALKKIKLVNAAKRFLQKKPAFPKIVSPQIIKLINQFMKKKSWMTARILPEVLSH